MTNIFYMLVVDYSLVRIGIPNAMFYYTYYPMWCVFLEELGFQVINSGPTTEHILDLGQQAASADACLPVKIFLGHVMTLKDKVDYLFIPRLVSLNKKTTYCPYFLGLPDMVRYISTELPPIIDVRFDMRHYRHTIVRAYGAVGKLVGANIFTTLKAYTRARLMQAKFQKKLHQGFQPPETIDIICNRSKIEPGDKNSWLTVAIIGYPYLIHDALISIHVTNILREAGIEVITSDNLTSFQINRQRYPEGKRQLWTLSDRVLRAAYYFAGSPKTDAMVHITSGGCQPDTVLGVLTQDRAATLGMPYLHLTMDERIYSAEIEDKINTLIELALKFKKSKLQSK